MNISGNRPFQILLIITVTALLSSCSAVNEDSNLALVNSEGNHSAQWVVDHGPYAMSDETLCTPCHGGGLNGGISGVSCSTTSYAGQSCHANGPGLHPEDWLNKNASGSTWHADAYRDRLLSGSLDCEACHTPPPLDDPAEGKCILCHFDLTGSRSPGGWTHGAADHSSFAGSPEEPVCVACHEVNNRFGNGPLCHNCHLQVTVPHTAGWLDRVAPDFHALAYNPADDSCSLCHDPAQPGTSPGYVCLDCHFSEDGTQRVPAGSGYVHGERSPEHESFSADEAQVCINCHDTNVQYGNQTSCHNCHDLIQLPHTSGWLDKAATDFHALAYSPAVDSCSTCHDPAQPATSPGYVCLDCHFSEDGTQRVPAGSGYVHGERSPEHESFSADEAQVCINCHDTNLLYDNQASCHNCHTLAAPHAVEYLDHNSAVTTFDTYTTECSTCHSMNPPPVTSAPVCTACHTVGSPYTYTGCTSCHGQPPSTGRHRNHSGEATCSDCHQGAGSDSGLNHFYDGTVDVVFSVAAFTYSGGRCNGSCHDKNHNNFNW